MGKLVLGTAMTLALVAGMALAQEGSAPDTAGAPQPPQARPLTQADRIADGQSIVKRGHVLSKRVRTTLNIARKEADIIMATCLNDKLMQINANLRNAEARLEALVGAVEPGQVEHEHVVLLVIGEKFDTLDREAAQCAGQELYDTGVTKVVTEIDINSLPFEDRPGFPPEILYPGLPTFPPPASGQR